MQHDGAVGELPRAPCKVLHAQGRIDEREVDFALAGDGRQPKAEDGVAHREA